ncbi:nucleoside recognition membrane protein YjiH [Geomicrobium halophilum]|uniref:Nucleoside recognition membrane protein YjiH n=1 Tax=Geomicrobium halophilum TaxID=549000 RepID=A0A841Q096_9BACL|nr:YjiH family protein [Geomicrobium halophilum]MBB6448728.1 nucleoside recognition membrane protein YjiH [Geomicrobium halophilum]
MQLNSKKNIKDNELKYKLQFIIVSLIGILLFLIPVPVGEEITIGVGIMATFVQEAFADYIPQVMTIILILSVLLSVITKIWKPNLVLEKPFWRGLLDVNWVWLTFRILGALIAVLTIFEWGPEWIWSETSGGEVLYSLIPVLATWFFFAGLLLPVLIEFGLMEFAGTLLRNFMKPLFTIPGRSSIDALVSWMGSGTVGVLVTTQQYENGYYTQREGTVIATNFSIASIAFSILVVQFLDVSHMFVQFYFTVCVAGLITGMIVPRIPPLSRKKESYHEVSGKQIDEGNPQGMSYVRWGYERAIAKVKRTENFSSLAKQGVKNVIDIWVGLIPLVMALGTMALMLAEFTPIFHWISYPFVPLLNILQIPEATDAAIAVVVGFADMFLPAVIGGGIESELTRFVIACLSMTQLVYMSEVGVLLLRSSLPLNLFNLFVIFLQRTLISLPIIAVMAHVLFF